MADDIGQVPAGSGGRVLVVISIATILALSMWFSTKAFGPALGTEAMLRLLSLLESENLAAGRR